MTATARRGGFTLLELLLACAISLLLLAAIYVAFDMALKQADAGRDSVAYGEQARGVTNRMTLDFSHCITVMPPKSGGGLPDDSASASSGAAAATDPNALLAAAATDPSSVDVPEGTAAADLVFQGGLFGSDTQLTLFISRVPPSLSNPETAQGQGQSQGSGQAGVPYDPRPDLRRVIYYFVEGKGLCRQERPWVTAQGVRDTADPDSGHEDEDMISDAVKSVSFSYFDGSAWASSWSGSDTASDGASVKGPPRAIKVTMTIQAAGATEIRTVTQVILVRAAIGLYQPPPPPDDSGTTGTTGTSP